MAQLVGYSSYWQLSYYKTQNKHFASFIFLLPINFNEVYLGNTNTENLAAFFQKVTKNKGVKGKRGDIRLTKDKYKKIQDEEELLNDWLDMTL